MFSNNPDHGFHHDPFLGNVRSPIYKSKFGLLNNIFKSNSKHNSFNNGRVYYHPKKYQYHDRQGYDYDYHDGLEHFATNQQNYKIDNERFTDGSKQLNSKSSISQNNEGGSINDYSSQNVRDSELRNDITNADFRHNTKFDDSESDNADTTSDDTDLSALNVARDVLDTLRLIPVDGLKLSFGK